MSNPLIDAIKQSKKLEQIIDLCSLHLMEKDSQGKTALMHAILCGNVEVAKILLCEAGHFDNLGSNAYMYAVQQNLTEIVEEIEQNYAEQELNVKAPGHSETVWQVTKQNQMHHEQMQPMEQDLFTQFDMPPGMAPSVFVMQGPKGPNASSTIIASKALLSSEQYMKCVQAEYLINAIAAGNQSEIVRRKIKNLLDRDIQQILAEEYKISIEQLFAMLQ
ncbi:Ankyrin_repeat protein 2 [Hexamita inflata]|uniref:Ankyrin repeat protein 2 n=1 Tax=Hexamita inflata TaxID=28002 RepID=A0AA86UA22_9EUKA|nr:Ankyrin repeat protein 2 [Hexamita inflata]